MQTWPVDKLGNIKLKNFGLYSKDWYKFTYNYFIYIKLTISELHFL